MGTSNQDQLGQYLRQLRHERGMSTSQVARKADCADATVNRVERGGRRPSLELLSRLVEAVGGDYSDAVSLLALRDGVPEEVCSELASKIRATASSGTPSSRHRHTKA